MKTVQIVPATCYCNGRQVIAQHLNVISVSDNLFDHVQFKYTLFDERKQFAGEAMYELNGIEEYSTWDASAEGAYEIVAKGLGLEIVPEINDKMFTII